MPDTTKSEPSLRRSRQTSHHKHARDPRYVVSVYAWDRSERCYTRVGRYVVGRSLASARSLADRMVAAMPPIESTWSLRAYARSSWADVTIERYQRDDGQTHYRAPGFPLAPITVYHAAQSIDYVPSIGERGF